MEGITAVPGAGEREFVGMHDADTADAANAAQFSVRARLPFLSDQQRARSPQAVLDNLDAPAPS